MLWDAARSVALLCCFSLCWCGDHILFIPREEFRTGFFRPSETCSRGPRRFPPTPTPSGESPPAGASARVPVLTDRLRRGHRPSGRAASVRVQAPHWPSSLGLGAESMAVQGARRPFKQNKCPFLTQRPQEMPILLPKCSHRHLEACKFFQPELLTESKQWQTLPRHMPPSGTRAQPNGSS